MTMAPIPAPSPSDPNGVAFSILTEELRAMHETLKEVSETLSSFTEHGTSIRDLSPSVDTLALLLACHAMISQSVIPSPETMDSRMKYAMKCSMAMLDTINRLKLQRLQSLESSLGNINP